MLGTEEFLQPVLLPRSQRGYGTLYKSVHSAR